MKLKINYPKFRSDLMIVLNLVQIKNPVKMN
jgi:hypothetical protein